MICCLLTVANAKSVTLTEEQILAHANKLTGTSYTKGYCLEWLATKFWQALGAPYSSACCAYQYGTERMVSTSKNDIPIGADVFFSGSSVKCRNGHSAGHIGVYVGNNKIISLVHYSNDPENTSYVRVNKISEWENWGYKYRGWGYHKDVSITKSGTSESIPTTYEFIDVVYPKTFKINTSTGWYLSGGTLICDKELKTISSKIVNSSGSTVSGEKTVNISGHSYSIKSLDTLSSSDNGVKFSKITKAGSYTWILKATDTSGRVLTLEMPFEAVTSGSTSTSKKSAKWGQSTNDTVYTVTVTTDGNGTATANPTSGKTGTQVTLSAKPNSGYRIKDWQVVSGGVTVRNNKFTINTSNVTIKGIFEPIPVTVSMIDSVDLELGCRLKLNAVLSNGEDPVWWSNDAGTVMVSSDGYIVGCKPGTAVVTASYEKDANIFDTCVVTVKTPSGMSAMHDGDEWSVYINDDNRALIASFKPEKTGYYIFDSRYDIHDTYGYVYDSSWKLLAADDNSGENDHFRIRYRFTAGQTYYLVARLANPFMDDVLTIGIVADSIEPEKPAEEPAKEPEKDPAKDPEKDPAKDPEKDPAKDPADKPETVTIKGLKYKLDYTEKTAVFTGPKNKDIKTITIPASITVKGEKFYVTKIAADACRDLKSLEKVTIGKNVKKILANAFRGCTKLKYIYIKSTKLTAKNIGNSAFKTGCKKGKVKCPKNKVAEYKKILRSKGLKKSITFTK